MSASTARAFPRHTHDEYGIGVVDAGGHASWSGKGQVEAGPGYFICVNPGEVHDGRAIGGRPRSWRILYFDPAALADVRADIMEGAQGSFTFAAPVFADRGLHEAFETAFRHATPRAEPDAAMSCETAILRLVARLGAHSTARPRKSEGPTACIRRARQRIDADPAAPVTLMELAKEGRPEPLSVDPCVRARARIDAARLHPAATNRIGAATDPRRLRSGRGRNGRRLLRSESSHALVRAAVRRARRAATLSLPAEPCAGTPRPWRDCRTPWRCRTCVGALSFDPETTTCNLRPRTP